MDYLISLFAPASLGTQGVGTQNFLNHTKKSFVHKPGAKTLVICLPGWGQKLSRFERVKRFVYESHNSFLTYEFPRALLSDQKELTKEFFDIAALAVRNDIDSLKKEYGFTTCVLVGVSLGCALGSMIYKDNLNIDEIFLIVPGENVARDLWSGSRTRHLRKSYERQGISKAELEEYWFGLAPEHNLPADGAGAHLFFGKMDRVIPFRLSYKLYEKLVSGSFNVTVTVFPFGHYVVAVYFLLFPKRFLRLS